MQEFQKESKLLLRNLSADRATIITVVKDATRPAKVKTPESYFDHSFYKSSIDREVMFAFLTRTLQECLVGYHDMFITLFQLTDLDAAVVPKADKLLSRISESLCRGESRTVLERTHSLSPHDGHCARLTLCRTVSRMRPPYMSHAFMPEAYPVMVVLTRDMDPAACVARGHGLACLPDDHLSQEGILTQD
ncbi:hypothetical protein CYMTET_26309 [Cymbomonas tetramitiformis]|uniref:Uncharacterized protein n=1 Tax=Cymbomonas tetramitiformis TaxID=36881 RepID=A0AAE0KYC8_9CHLO|nr:hypothetical protein CYMTET_26309 [Cymbomonas tetramitiformis]